MGQDRLPYFELTQCVEIDFVDCAAGCNESNHVLLSCLYETSAYPAGSHAVIPGRRRQQQCCRLEVKGGIGVATAEYIVSGIRHAEDRDAELLVIKIDTPGGLLNPMRDIIQDILASRVPVATYVTPDGARADSAGTYILMASHVAAMTPTTSIGAATPVSMTGDDATPAPLPDTQPEPAPEPDAEGTAEEPAESASEEMQDLPGTAMERKVLNDAVSYIRSLAERYDRNADWAEDAVVECGDPDR